MIQFSAGLQDSDHDDIQETATRLNRDDNQCEMSLPGYR